MESHNKKCSLKEHSDISADIYCKKCEKFMCNECEINHSKQFEDHQDFILNENLDEIFNEYCQEEKHQCFKLEYFCKNHNKLCCSACIAKIKGDKVGEHINCDTCNIDLIKEEKITKVKDNIKLLEEMSSKFNDEYFTEIKNIFKEINEEKEKLKLKIKNIFTVLKDALNNRENELLVNVDKEYDDLFGKDNIIKDIELVPNKIKLSLDKLKDIENSQTEDNIYELIDKCIKVENEINIINNIDSNINNIYDSKSTQIKFIPEESQINEFIDSVQNFGDLKVIQTIDDNVVNLSSIIEDDKITCNDLIHKWIEEEINKKEIKFKSIFKMSENGTTSEDFHKYCDNKGPTLILIKTTKNKIFGGFTPLNWKNKGFWIKDSNNRTFIFSLNSKKKYKLLTENSDGIFCFDIFGPNFGGYYFWLKKDMRTGEANIGRKYNLFFVDDFNSKKKDGEYQNFQVEELEVYKVLY